MKNAEKCVKINEKAVAFFSFLYYNYCQTIHLEELKIGETKEKMSLIKMIRKKPSRKVLIQSLTSCTLALIGIVCGNIKDKKLIYVLFVVAVVLAVINTFVSLLNATDEAKDKEANKVKDREIKTYNGLLSGIVALCASTTSDVNNLIKCLMEDRKKDGKLWNFDKACNALCFDAYNIVCSYLSDGPNEDISVSYVKLIDEQPYEKVRMNAYYPYNAREKPSIFNKDRKINDRSKYFRLGLFKKNSPDVAILIDRKEINDNFRFRSGKNNLSKYNQYIGIPVYCDRRKMVGLLEITCFKNAFIPQDKEEVLEFVRKFIVPYTSIILVLYKMEKLFLAQSREVI